MPKMRGFLRSKTKIDEADWAIAQLRTAVRLDDMFPPDEASADEVRSHRSVDGDETAMSTSSIVVGPGLWPGGPRPPIIVVGAANVVSSDGAADAGAVEAEAEAEGRPVEVHVNPVEARTNSFQARTSPVDADAGQAEAEAITSEPNGGEPIGVEPIGVMARAGDVVGADTWRLPAVAVPDPVIARTITADVFPTRPAPGQDVPAEPEPAEPSPAKPTLAAISVAEPSPAEHASASASTAGPATGRRSSPRRSTADRATTAVSPAKRSAASGSPAKRGTAVASSAKRSAALASPAKRSTASGSPAKRGTAVASPARRATRKKVRSTPVPMAVAHCPYCAMLLEPAPTTSKRCDRCRQRIIVKRVDKAPVYLTEAAVLVFDAERRRVVNSVRWTRERDRWLRLASAAGAAAQRRAQLAAARLSEDAVSAARTLYLTTVDRAFRAARRDRDWEAASRLRRDKAAVLYRVAGSPVPPPADVVAIFREGVAAELRSVAGIARDAELVSARCCDVCQADDRLIVRITQELRTPRLPHVGCPKGLCRCHWDLATRDRVTMRRYLRRRQGVASPS